MGRTEGGGVSCAAVLLVRLPPPLPALHPGKRGGRCTVREPAPRGEMRYVLTLESKAARAVGAVGAAGAAGPAGAAGAADEFTFSPSIN